MAVLKRVHFLLEEHFSTNTDTDRDSMDLLYSILT